jgi:hypothetical protein
MSRDNCGVIFLATSCSKSDASLGLVLLVALNPLILAESNLIGRDDQENFVT